MNVKTSSCKVLVILVGFSRKLNFLDKVSKKAQLSSFSVQAVVQLPTLACISLTISNVHKLGLLSTYLLQISTDIRLPGII